EEAGSRTHLLDSRGRAPEAVSNPPDRGSEAPNASSEVLLPPRHAVVGRSSMRPVLALPVEEHCPGPSGVGQAERVARPPWIHAEAVQRDHAVAGKRVAQTGQNRVLNRRTRSLPPGVDNEGVPLSELAVGALEPLVGSDVAGLVDPDEHREP